MIYAYVQMVIALVFVIGLILLVRYFVAKKQDKAGFIQILAYQSFGPRKGIAALKVRNEVLLVGITATDLKLLKTYESYELDMDRLRGIEEHLNEYK